MAGKLTIGTRVVARDCAPRYIGLVGTIVATEADDEWPYEVDFDDHDVERRILFDDDHLHAVDPMPTDPKEIEQWLER